MHVYNNYYNNIGVPGNNGSFMGIGWGAQFIVENNYFGSKLGVRNIEWFANIPEEYTPKFYYSGNNYTDPLWWGQDASYPTRERPSDPKPWEPPYEYVLEPYAGLPESIPAAAGPTLFK